MSTATQPPGSRRTGQLQAEDVAVSYGPVTALRAITLDLQPGSVTAVTGPSGAGKSSLLWALSGALHPARGTIHFAGTPITGRQQAAELGIALIPQGNGLAAALTATENVLIPLLATGTPLREARHRAVQALTAVDLPDSGDHLIEELSGGQQQRVAVARALAAHPSVLLADEPTSDLDSVNRERIIALLRDQATAGAVVVMSTHDPEAAAQADTELTLDEGTLRHRPQ